MYLFRKSLTLVSCLLFSGVLMAQGGPPPGGGAPPGGGGPQGGPPPGGGGPPGMMGAAAVDRSEDCNRQCLLGFADRYLQALEKDDLSLLEVTNDIRVSENSHHISLGDNSWKTIQKVRPNRMVLADPYAGQVLILATVEMGAGEPFIYSTRLMVEKDKISEVEIMIASERNAGVHFRPDLMDEATAVFNQDLPANQSMSRADLLKAARISWGQDEGTAPAVASDCLRYENWEAGAEPCRAGGGGRQGRNYRIPLVDTEKGIVVSYQLQDSANPMGSRNGGGETPPFYYTPLTFYVLTMTKIDKDEVLSNALFMSLQELYVGTVFQ